MTKIGDLLKMGESLKDKEFVFSYSLSFSYNEGFLGKKFIKFIFGGKIKEFSFGGKIKEFSINSGDFFAVMNLATDAPTSKFHLVWNDREAWVCRPFIAVLKEGGKPEGGYKDYDAYWGQLVIGKEKFGEKFINHPPVVVSAFDVINPHAANGEQGWVLLSGMGGNGTVVMVAGY